MRNGKSENARANIELLLKLAKLPRSNYYYCCKHLGRITSHAQERGLIRTLCQEHQGRYGYRRITLALRNKGYSINHKLVMKLMKAEGLTCQLRTKRYRSYRGQVGKTAPNLLNRNFLAIRPNQKWVTDLTEFKVLGKRFYLSPILDLFNGEIVSYNLSTSPSFGQVVDMLMEAFKRLPAKADLLLHSDQGWQYQMKQYQYLLKSHKIKQSMSRKGNCLDNAVMENFFGLLKSEFLYLQEFETIEQFIKELEEYIYYYNYLRIKSKLKGLSPVNYRIQSSLVA